MRISRLRTVRVEVPLKEPFRTAIHDIRSVGCVLVFLDGDDGSVGESYLWLSSTGRLRVLEQMVLSLADFVVGRDPSDIGAIAKAMWADVNLLGYQGVSMFGISAIDAACWDLIGKSEGQPVHRLLGTVRTRIPVYADGGLFVTMTADELQAQARDFVARGYRAVKMRLGRPTWQEDLERIGAVREAIGPEVALLVDANQGYDVKTAIRLGLALADLDVAWFEEPVFAHDLDANARVTAAIETPVAIGQNLYARHEFARALDIGAADILMPDLQRVGGVSEFVKIAHAAEARDVPISPHMFVEHCLPLCGALANCVYAENMPWFAPLLNEPLEMEDGALVIPQRPGLGFTFDPEAVARFTIRD